jgi:hypothetical protein
MELEDLKAMLEDQRLVVRALSSLRRITLKKYGASSPQYEKITRLYHKRIQDYRSLELEAAVQRSYNEMLECVKSIGTYFSNLRTQIDRELEAWKNENIK